MMVYERVRAALQMGKRASSASYGEMVDALDAAEENASQAMELFINAKVSLDAFEIDATIVESGMRDQAVALLEEEKARGERKKAITNGDVEAVMAARFPDEWQDLSRRRGQAKRTVDMLSDLCERCRERAKDLRAMVSKYRGD